MTVVGNEGESARERASVGAKLYTKSNRMCVFAYRDTDTFSVCRSLELTPHNFGDFACSHHQNERRTFRNFDISPSNATNHYY